MRQQLGDRPSTSVHTGAGAKRGDFWQDPFPRARAWLGLERLEEGWDGEGGLDSAFDDPMRIAYSLIMSRSLRRRRRGRKIVRETDRV